MKEFLLDFLICPSCLPEEYPLQERIETKEAHDIIYGTLNCPHCGKAFPIREGIAFLDPNPDWKPIPGNKYETPQALSSYLWSHYGDLMGEEGHIDAYRKWAEIMDSSDGLVVDVGCAVGRFALEMSEKSRFVVGLDVSLLFVSTARKLIKEGELKVKLFEEGLITREKTLSLAPSWYSEGTEFIIADALHLPFKSETVSVVSSLNVIDKVPNPLKHLTEMNRIARHYRAQCIVSDPFSWSLEASPVELWLGGKDSGDFSGYGLDNIVGLLESGNGGLNPPWRVVHRGYVWWKLRTHRNHFELIRSLFIKAMR
ncbi:MAG: methyltransferase domain-containing protein [Syntrophobacterales bacterium]|nr:methyltransferase domain-containing protein [Syntrophobacterales bacterium]